MIKGLDHINIRTADLAATKAFFVDILGLSDGWRPNVSRPGAWLYSGERALVHLSQADGPVTPSKGSSLDHFACRSTTTTRPSACWRRMGSSTGPAAPRPTASASWWCAIPAE